MHITVTIEIKFNLENGKNLDSFDYYDTVYSEHYDFKLSKILMTMDTQCYFQGANLFFTLVIMYTLRNF